MLRRTQSVARKIDLPEADDLEAEIERIVPPRAAARRPANSDHVLQEAAPPLLERREGDRRQAERRGMEALRAEALQAVISKVEDRNFGGLRAAAAWRPRLAIPPSRLILLAVALLAGGLAAFLATRHDAPAPVAIAAIPAPAEIAATPAARVLVAKANIAAGDRLTPDNLQWLDWPSSGLQDDFITEATTPDAPTSLAGNAARSDILAGEPIRKARLAAPDGSFLAAILDKGMRGVSVTVSADSASGGFVAPNDQVDVVLTRNGGPTQDAQTILSGVTVLAINGRVGRASSDSSTPQKPDGETSETFANQAIATLALDPGQAEMLIAATAIGKLSLVLRPSGTPPLDAAAATERAANAAIRLKSPFWTNAAPSPQ